MQMNRSEKILAIHNNNEQRLLGECMNNTWLTLSENEPNAKVGKLKIPHFIWNLA